MWTARKNAPEDGGWRNVRNSVVRITDDGRENGQWGVGILESPSHGEGIAGHIGYPELSQDE